MASTDSDRALVEADAARERAAAALAGLQEAKALLDREGAASGRADAYKAVTGRSAVENAIVEAKRIIETLDRALKDAKREAALGSATGADGIG